MDVFISWSGDRSKALAEALRGWLPKIINAVKPWLSCADIDKGTRWGIDVASNLQAAKVGIICLTPENVHADWILFEAGALSKTLANTFVCPLLIDIEPSDLSGPLAQFQVTRATEGEIKSLVHTINRALGDDALPSSQIDEVVETFWPKLKAVLETLPADGSEKRPIREEREMLEEILDLLRRDVNRATAVGDQPWIQPRSLLIKQFDEVLLHVARNLGLSADIVSIQAMKNGEVAFVTLVDQVFHRFVVNENATLAEIASKIEAALLGRDAQRSETSFAQQSPRLPANSTS